MDLPFLFVDSSIRCAYIEAPRLHDGNYFSNPALLAETLLYLPTYLPTSRPVAVGPERRGDHTLCMTMYWHTACP